MHDGAAAAFESTHRIDAGLRAFDGHFPGAPVLPGAYLLALVLHQLEQQPALRARLGAALQVQ
jgi:3-hydroxymyristoyl/3-hydroxydecanoyl-(acyl carrier protein) dehydratase